jgi:PST family polysaccharide transporter
VQPQTVLVKRLDYRRLSLRSVVANVLAGAAGIAAAGLVTPVCGLVTYQLGQSLLSFIGTSVGRGLMARPRLHDDCLRQLRRETIFATGNRSLAAIINYLDQTVMAPLAGDTALAFYNLGKRLETTFVTVANSFSSILFQPLFAADGALSRQKATTRALLVLTLVCGAPAAVVFCNDRLVVSLIFGRNWLAAAPIVGWLCLNGLIRAVGMVPGSFLSVSGRNQDLLVTSIVSAVLGLALVVAIAPTSITLCAAAMAGKNAAIVVWMAWLTRREVEHPLSTYAMGVVIPASLMLAAAFAVSIALQTPVNLFAVLFKLALSGLVVVACCVAWVALTGAPSLRILSRAPSGRTA